MSSGASDRSSPSGTAGKLDAPSVKSTARVFFALWPDGQVRRQLARAAIALHKACGGRGTRAETIHLTLVFLGEVEAKRLDALHTAAAAINGRRFCIELDRLGHWKHNRIAWAAPRQCPIELTSLVDALRDGLSGEGFRFDRRSYSPHITLVRKALCREMAPLPETIRWEVSEFVLVQSALASGGSVYTVIGRWPLA